MSEEDVEKKKEELEPKGKTIMAPPFPVYNVKDPGPSEWSALTKYSLLQPEAATNRMVEDRVPNDIRLAIMEFRARAMIWLSWWIEKPESKFKKALADGIEKTGLKGGPARQLEVWCAEKRVEFSEQKKPATKGDCVEICSQMIRMNIMEAIKFAHRPGTNVRLIRMENVENLIADCVMRIKATENLLMRKFPDLAPASFAEETLAVAEEFEKKRIEREESESTAEEPAHSEIPLDTSEASRHDADVVAETEKPNEES